MTPTTFFNAMHSALSHGLNIDVIEGELVAHRSQDTTPERLGRIAKVVAEHLKNTPRVSPSEGLSHIAATSTRMFLKKVSNNQETDPRIIHLAREHLAFKIGVSSQVFDTNPGFEKYCSSPPLERYLAEYGHRVRVNDSGEVELLQGGTYRPWSALQEEVKPPENKNPETYQKWTYGPDGVQSKNMFEWTTLEPYKQEDPSQWGNQYLFEFCCCCEKEPRFVGDHSWLRLKDPDGNVYSVGLYRPYKPNPKMDTKNPMRIKKGHLMSPDVSEYWPTPIHRIPIAITQEQFEQMKGTIEADKNKDAQIFHLIGDNCTRYVANIARIANISLPISKPGWRLLMPWLEKPMDRVARWMPSRVQNIGATAIAVIINLGLLWHGARLVDPQVAPTQPHIASYWDVFKPSKLDTEHPHTVAYTAKRQIDAWRAENRQDRFALPPSMRFIVC